MKFVWICMLGAMLWVSGVVTLAQPIMPDYVIRTIQEINAIYGEGTIDINNTGWDWRGGSIGDGFNLTAGCTSPITLPVSTTATEYYRVFFDTDFNGAAEWTVIVYSDYTYFGLCDVPQYECGVLPPRLAVGRVAHISPDGFPNNLRAVPGESGQLVGEIPAGAEFTIVDGPRCASGISFWLVDYNQTQGWTAEGRDTEYFITPGGIPEVVAVNITPIAPATPQATAIPTFVCGGVQSRLYVGLTAQVTPGFPNNLRAQPGESGQYLGEIPPGFPFEIVGGPQCNSGLQWWQVNYQGTIGWTAEAGSVDDYWLEPVGLTVETINIGTLARLGQVDTLTPDITGVYRSLFINGRNDIIGVYSDGRRWTWNPTDPTLARPDTTWTAPNLTQLPDFPIASQLDSTGQVIAMVPSTTNGTQVQLAGGTFFDEFDLSRDNRLFNNGAIHPIDNDMLVVSQMGQGFIFVDSNPDSTTYRSVSQAARVLLPDEVYLQIEFSANGQRLVGLTDKNHLVVWTGAGANPATWAVDYPVIFEDEPVIMDFSLSADGSKLLITGLRAVPNTNLEDGFFSLYNILPNGLEEVATVYLDRWSDRAAIEFSPDGSWLAVTSGNHELRFFDTATLTQRHQVETNFEHVTDIVFNDDASLMAMVTQYNNIFVWRVR